MNRTDLLAWRSLTDDGSVRWLEYSFGPGTANTLAVRLDDGGWMVLSPATGAPPSVLDELAVEGPVSALVAPNAFHHLGQQPWRLRFADATSYAPAGALPRLAKKSMAVPFLSTDELARRLPARIAIVVPDGLKSPDLLVRVSVRRATIWWMGDLFSNVTLDDQVWWLRLLSRFAGSGLGYRRNGKPGLVYVKDERAWLGSIRDALTKDPPAIVVPAHGDPVTDDTARRTLDLVTG